MVRSILLSTLLFVVCTSVYSGTEEKLQGMDEFIESEMQYWQVPGLALAVVRNDKVIYKRTFGVADLQNGDSINSATLFSIASTTKTFTATLAGMLADEGKLDLNAPIADYIPDFEMSTSEASRRLTIKHFLAHTSGLPRHDIVWDNEPAGRAELVEQIKKLELTCYPGEKWQYSNLNYIMAADIIEKVSGETWEELLQKRILDPIGMDGTVLSVNQKKHLRASPYITRLHNKVEKLDFKNSDILGPAGGIRSNIDDMSKWLIFNMKTGAFDGKQLIKPATIKYLGTPVSLTGGGIRDTEIFYSTYGFGRFIDSYKGKMRIHHGGTLFGFASQMSFLPFENVGVVILANMNGTPLTGIIEQTIYDRVLELDETEWNYRVRNRHERMMQYYEKMAEQAEDNTEPSDKSPFSPDEMVGKYENPGYGCFEIIKTGDSLSVKTSIYNFPLIHHNENKYKMINEISGEQFILDFISEDGRIKHFESKFEPRCRPILFKKSGN